MRDVHEVLEELARHVLVARIQAAELHGDLEQVQTVHSHPARAVGLLDESADRELRAAIEDADVVETEEASLKDVVPREVLAVDPPGEVQQELVEDLLEEHRIDAAAVALLDLVDAPGRPRVHGRVDVAECPFVSGDLAVRMHVPFAQQELQLPLREIGVDERERHAVKTEVPGGVPRILPLVGHRQHVLVVEMRPVGIPAMEPLRRRRRLRRVAAQPGRDVVIVELLAPQEPGECLPADVAAVGVERGRKHVRRRTRSPRRDAASKTVSNSAPKTPCAVDSSSRRRSSSVACAPGAIVNG